METIITIADIIYSNSGQISYAVLIIGICVCFIVGISEYKDRLWRYITNRRNKWWCIALTIALMLIVISRVTGLIHGWSIVAISVLWIIAAVIFIKSLKPKTFTGFSVLPLIQYEKWLLEGSAIEHISFFEDRKPRYILSAGDKIEYYMLACQYFTDVADFEKAFKALANIKEDSLYDEEKQIIKIQSSILLALMGNMKAAYNLLGEPEKNESNHPMVWFAYSFIFENKGDIDKALEYAERSRSIIDAGYKTRDTMAAQVYNNYARVAIMKGNRQEALRYYDIAFNKLKKTKDIRLIHVVAKNRIIEMSVSGRSLTDCEEALDEYAGLIPNNSFMNKVELNNCAIVLYRQFRDSKKVNELIKNGYEEIIEHLDSEKAFLFTASTFTMLMNEQLDHSWFDKYICKNMAEYMKLPLVERLVVFKTYLSFYEQEAFRALYNRSPYLGLQKKIMRYYREQAIEEIDDALKTVDPRNIYAYLTLMNHKLWILKLVEGKQHINKSKEMYVDLYKEIYDNGLHLDAISVLMSLVDECTSPYNKLIITPYAPAPINYSDMLKASESLPEPILLEDGVHLSYPRIVPREPFIIAPLQLAVINEHIDTIINEVRQWKSHPRLVDLCVEIMHILMCLNRKEDAIEFYQFYEDSGVAETQFAAWARETIADMKKELGIL